MFVVLYEALVLPVNICNNAASFSILAAVLILGNQIILSGIILLVACLRESGYFDIEFW